MREIKFRAWDKYQKKIYDVIAIDFKAHTVKVFEFDRIGSYCSGNIDLPFESISLMQYTGLKDKNGKEIYEGDVVDRYYDSPDTELYREVIEDIRVYCCFDCVYEVIGTIHESPELLKE